MRKANLLAAIIVASALVTGCAATLPKQTIVNSGYTLEGIKAVSVNTTCPSPKLDSVKPSFVPQYCQLLGSSAKLAIQSKYPAWQLKDSDADARIDILLEELYGGSSQARFWIGFGAGRTATTVYVRVIRNNVTIAEGRLIETSTMPNVAAGNWSNEELLSQDAPLMGRKIADFVTDPHSFK